MPDILCMGEPMLELNRQPSGPDGRVLYLEGHGGDTSNAAVAAVRSGASAGYITAIGQDGPGDSLMALWAREGVDTATVARHADAPTGLYVVSHGEDGHRFTYYRAGSAASRMGPVEVPEDIHERMEAAYREGWSLSDALEGTVATLAGEGAAIQPDNLEVAVLERSRTGRAFRRIEQEDLVSLLG